MGIHAENEALTADPTIDPLRPELLLYIPDKHGKLRLVGVEYWKADADQNLATSGDRPSLFGRPFDGPMPGHNPTMPVHYDLHVWLWEDNPSGYSRRSIRIWPARLPSVLGGGRGGCPRRAAPSLARRSQESRGTRIDLLDELPTATTPGRCEIWGVSPV